MKRFFMFLLWFLIASAIDTELRKCAVVWPHYADALNAAAFVCVFYVGSHIVRKKYTGWWFQ